MAQGLEIYNDNNSLLLSSDTIPILYQQKVVSRVTSNVNSKVLLSKKDGVLSVYYFDCKNDVNRISDYGVFSPFGAGDNYYILPDKMGASEHIDVEEYQFKAQIKYSCNAGLQLFNASGVEVYNSNHVPLTIVDKVSIDVSNSWYPMSTKSWGKIYTGRTKLGFLFTNIPAGITKSKTYSGVYAYDYRPYCDNEGFISISYTPTIWTYSYSSAEIPIDRSLRLEFFVVDLSGLY